MLFSDSQQKIVKYEAPNSLDLIFANPLSPGFVFSVSVSFSWFSLSLSLSLSHSVTLYLSLGFSFLIFAIIRDVLQLFCCCLGVSFIEQ
jgi:hypothetical protein